MIPDLTRRAHYLLISTMKKPDADEIRLFRDSVGKVRPVRHDRIQAPRRAVSTRPQFRERDEEKVLQDMMSEHFEPADTETGEELLFMRTGLQQRVLRKLRRGLFVIGAELDLHGMTVPVARQAVVAFLLESKRQRIQCVRIIHGKGRGSRHRAPVLKQKVGRWLPQRDEVLAYCSARDYDGGTGAVYVLLKRG